LLEILYTGISVDHLHDEITPAASPDLIFMEASKMFLVLVSRIVSHQTPSDVDTIMRIVETTLTHERLEVFQAMLDTLLAFVRGIYEHIEPFRSSLAVAPLRSGILARQLAVLNFWDEFSHFEAELRGNCLGLPPRSSLFSSTSFTSSSRNLRLCRSTFQRRGCLSSLFSAAPA
jgi:hypothetical protein